MSRKRRRTAAAGDGAFTRGFVAAACISAFQDRPAPDARRVLRRALQGGAALSAGSRAADSLRRGRYVGALAAAAAGAAAVYLIENLLGASARREEKPDGQESQEEEQAAG